MFVETAGACVQFTITNFRAKEMMPMADFINNNLFSAITKAASFAAHSVALLTTGDASFATVLHNS